MDRISSIKLAIDNEQREKDFYLSEAKRSKNPVVVRLMKTLAQEEEDHKTLIMGLHERLTQNGSWPEDMPLNLKETVVVDELNKLDYKAQNASEHDDTDLENLKKSIAFEKEAADFYSGLAKTTQNIQEKTFFDFLSKIEHQHMLSIQDSLNYLEDPQGWFEATEKHGLDAG